MERHVWHNLVFLPRDAL